MAARTCVAHTSEHVTICVLRLEMAKVNEYNFVSCIYSVGYVLHGRCSTVVRASAAQPRGLGFEFSCFHFEVWGIFSLHVALVQISEYLAVDGGGGI